LSGGLYAWLTEHAIALDPKNTAAITCQAKLFRDRGQHEDGLRLTAPFAQTTNVALLTVRGHLLADVGQVDEAMQVARRAYALAKKTGMPTQPLSVLLTRLEKA
jgi:Flp pilus assembly protein TadD